MKHPLEKNNHTRYNVSTMFMEKLRRLWAKNVVWLLDNDNK